MLEPGRALVADAVDLACTVVAVKTLPTAARAPSSTPARTCCPARCGRGRGSRRSKPAAGRAPTLVAGPLCLNIDVLAPAAALGELAVGDVLVARDVGAYQQVQSTQFGDLRPAVVAREGGSWRLHRRREELSDLIIFDREEPSWSA